MCFCCCQLLDLTKFELSDSKKQLVDIVGVAQEAVLWSQKAIESKVSWFHKKKEPKLRAVCFRSSGAPAFAC